MKRKTTAITAVMLAASLSAAAQDVTFDGALVKIESILSGGANTLFHVVSIIIGLVGIVMLIWKFIEQNRGSRESNQALAGIAYALLIVALLMQVIRFIFIR